MAPFYQVLKPQWALAQMWTSWLSPRFADQKNNSNNKKQNKMRLREAG